MRYLIASLEQIIVIKCNKNPLVISLISFMFIRVKVEVTFIDTCLRII